MKTGKTKEDEREILMIDWKMICTKQFNLWLKTKWLWSSILVNQYASLPFTQRPVIKVTQTYLDAVNFLFQRRWITAAYIFPEDSNAFAWILVSIKKTKTKKNLNLIYRRQHWIMCMKVSEPWTCKRLGSYENQWKKLKRAKWQITVEREQWAERKCPLES